MVDRTAVQNQLKTLYSTVQVRDRLAGAVLGILCVARICFMSNLAVYEGLQLVFRQQELPSEVSITHVK